MWRNFFCTKQLPTEVRLGKALGEVEGNAWFNNDSFGNVIEIGDHVLVTEAGEDIHIDAVEDYLIEKLHAKVATIEGNTSNQIFLLPNGTWVDDANKEAFLIDYLNAQVYIRTEKKAVL